MQAPMVCNCILHFKFHLFFDAAICYILNLGFKSRPSTLQAMFYPQLFGIVGEILVTTPALQYDDPEDLLDDKQLLEVMLLNIEGRNPP